MFPHTGLSIQPYCCRDRERREREERERQQQAAAALKKAEHERVERERKDQQMRIERDRILHESAAAVDAVNQHFHESLSRLTHKVTGLARIISWVGE